MADYTFGNDSAEQNQIIVTKRQAAYKEELGESTTHDI